MRAQPQAAAFRLEIEILVDAQHQRQVFGRRRSDAQLCNRAAQRRDAKRTHAGKPGDRIGPGASGIDQNRTFQFLAACQGELPAQRRAAGAQQT